MIKISGKIVSIFVPCLALIVSCSNNNANQENSKAILDTVSLSNKNFALAYQDGDKIVATSIDTMKQISFGGAVNPAISPDGNKLAYTVTDSSGHKGIWIADLENKSQLQLQVNSTNFDHAVWSPDGNSIAFNILSKKGRWKVGVIKTDNTGFVILGEVSSTNVYAPTWKNEKELVAHDIVNLFTYDISGRLIDTKPIFSLIGNDLSIAENNSFFYTSDGQKLIFNAGNKDILDGFTGRSEAVYSMDLASKKIDRISPTGMNVPYVLVTADDRIFYSGADKPYTQSRIYVSDLSGNVKLVVDKGINPTGALK